MTAEYLVAREEHRGAFGETLEGVAVRKMWEETGLVAAQQAYVGSHPWSFSGPAVLLAGFTATITDPSPRLDPGEIAQARWLRRAQLRELPPGELPTFPYTTSLTSVPRSPTRR